MDNQIKRKIILEDGSEFSGYSFGSGSEKLLELVFNTSMAGYQEILSDPSYTGQAVVMTYPVVGNYGINKDDFETKVPSIGAMIVREYTPIPSNFRSEKTLSDFMKEYDIAGVYGIDTRKLTMKIRDYGSCKVLITDGDVTKEEGLKKLSSFEYPVDHVSHVSTKKPWTTDNINDTSCLHVAAIDCGIKLNIVRELVAHGCRVTVLPYDSKPEDIDALKPDGIFLSNGPGDPADVKETIELVKNLKGRYPIFGICLGHQILSLAYGAATYKLKFGHRGGNHPVKDLTTGLIDITSQNHSYAVDEKSLEGTGLKVSNINILDNTVEGVCHMSDPSFGIQYHPEACPGPCDSNHLFDRFVKMMRGESINA
ncbi:MAG: glutamine-hydrolyzing carbamoyl-phosphate synthase small subunit [Lachnospiraceae bacterium]|nr:glutamine-hydrolyzing carbamoyl-phosphate synthase small subunit [Lachnospiraceae bacterium]